MNTETFQTAAENKGRQQAIATILTFLPGQLNSTPNLMDIMNTLKAIVQREQYGVITQIPGLNDAIIQECNSFYHNLSTLLNNHLLQLQNEFIQL